MSGRIIPSPYISREKNIEHQDDWHFSHLGRDYFLNIASLTCFNNSLDVPIKTVFIGKKGRPYITSRIGKNVNPNWAIITESNKQIRCKSSSNTIERGLWDISNCHVFDWEEIKEFFTNQIKIKHN